MMCYFTPQINIVLYYLVKYIRSNVKLDQGMVVLTNLG